MVGVFQARVERRIICMDQYGPGTSYSRFHYFIFFLPEARITSAMILYKYFKDVSLEFDGFRVNTHLCKLRCWYL